MSSPKSAIVTGSTSGIGLGIARALGQAGVNVMLNGFGESTALERLCRELAAETTGRIAFHPADVTRPADVRAMVDAAEQAFGGVDILVSNAGLRVGELVTWPSLVTHPHRGNQLRSGVKYGLTIWFELPVI